MRHITIQECFESLQIGEETFNSLSQREVDELNEYIISKGLDQNNIIWGRKTITFVNYVGYIKLSTVSIEILPKVNINSNPEEERKVLLNMLVKSGIIKVNYSDINLVNLYKMNLNEILSYLFAYKLHKELTKGLYQEYVYSKDNLNLLKGTLIVQKHIKNIASATPKAFCRYEEFSVDNKLNQVLTYCIKKLIKEVKNPETIKILRHEKMYFSNVTEKEISNIELLNYKFNRLNVRFEEVFILAKMILGGCSSLGNAGDEKSFSILFRMDEIFEKYITKILYINLKDLRIHSQHSKYKLLVNEVSNKEIFKLKPDIVIEQNGIESIIIDTKWKKISDTFNRHGVKREDLYQMYAYLTRYPDVKTVILLYPFNEEIKRTEKRYLQSWMLSDNQDKKIRVYAVKLDNERVTMESLNQIINDIKQ
ncbi:McrC family protein [Clostridium botulinum]|uniref:McrC family protein n=1 Tax=Clostridium botulinum TaxID=1491 RepID=UPI0013C702BC|nr:McrC family protein [Clostridium botulinum]MBY7024814.1 McrC family protein [Clostridium botulinum]NFN19709.1 hypothetical protein [Clostridium botulinum]